MHNAAGVAVNAAAAAAVQLAMAYGMISTLAIMLYDLVSLLPCNQQPPPEAADSLFSPLPLATLK